MIKVENLRKNYGKIKALRGISFEIEKGEIVGFLGPNGAGKTTTMRILTGFMPATSGQASIADHDVFRHPMKIRKRIGYLPENVPLYPEMTVSGYLKFVAQIKGVPTQKRSDRLDFVLEACNLTDRKDQIIGKLSKGYRQRVGLAQALIHDPDVIILDEPTSGLDPRQIIDIRKLISQLGKDRTILLSTHILSEVSATCQRMIIINNGYISGDTLIENGKAVTDLDEGQIIELKIGGNFSEISETLKKIDQISIVDLEGQNSENFFRVRSATDRRAEIAEAVVKNGFQLLELRSIEMTVEQFFLKLISNRSHAK